MLRAFTCLCVQLHVFLIQFWRRKNANIKGDINVEDNVNNKLYDSF